MEVRTLVTFRSDKFNTTESKRNYINSGCFGDDVADWFVQRLASSGMAVDPKIGQEDFGWYLGFRSGSYRYHFVLKSGSREKLNGLLRAMLAHAAAERIPRTQVIVDVDAVWLM